MAELQAYVFGVLFQAFRHEAPGSLDSTAFMAVVRGQASAWPVFMCPGSHPAYDCHLIVVKKIRIF